MSNEHAGFEIKIARLRAGRTQRSLAFELGVAPAVLSDFECGYRKLPPELIARLYLALGLTDPPRDPRQHASNDGRARR